MSIKVSEVQIDLWPNLPDYGLSKDLMHFSVELKYISDFAGFLFPCSTVCVNPACLLFQVFCDERGRLHLQCVL